MSDLALPVPDALVDAVARRVLALMPQHGEAPRWLNATAAADYLSCSKHRLYRLVHERRIPHEHEGARLLFDCAALDTWVRNGGAR